MNSQQLLIINFIIFAGLILLFIIGRSKPKKFLNLSARRTVADVNADTKNVNDVEKLASDVENIEVKNEQLSSAQPVMHIEEHKEEVLQAVKPVQVGSEIVYFVYNGHEWEAHEVLGIESGKSLEDVTFHYQQLIKTSDPSTFEFYEAAYSAVLKLKSPKW